MAKVLVSGVNGFVGHHLVRKLKEHGWSVVGVGYEPAPAEGLKKVIDEYIPCDLTNQAAVNKLPLDEVKALVNLAGLAAVGQSFDEPELYMQVNVGVIKTVCKRLKQINRKDLRLVAVSTGALYISEQSMPLNEGSKISGASSPYAASKLAMEETVRDFIAQGYDCVIVRPFNHIGSGQLPGFLLPDLFAKIKQNKSEIKVGNLKTERDYTDVRDVTNAYVSLVAKEKLNHHIYNVCSGKPVAGIEVLEKLKTVMGREDLKVIVDKALFRPSDAPLLYGNNTRLKTDTGWSPTISLEQTIRDFVAAN